MLRCFTARGLLIKTTPGTDRAILTGVGVVEEDHLMHGPGVVYEGPVSYVISTIPPPASAHKQAFIACVHNGFGGG
jgi:hypothetical protein